MGPVGSPPSRSEDAGPADQPPDTRQKGDDRLLYGKPGIGTRRLGLECHAFAAPGHVGREQDAMARARESGWLQGIEGAVVADSGVPHDEDLLVAFRSDQDTRLMDRHVSVTTET